MVAGACGRGGHSLHSGQEAGGEGAREEIEERKASKNKVPSRTFPGTYFLAQTPPPNVLSKRPAAETFEVLLLILHS